jgi:hypothetical protein
MDDSSTAVEMHVERYLEDACDIWGCKFCWAESHRKTLFSSWQRCCPESSKFFELLFLWVFLNLLLIINKEQELNRDSSNLR